MIQTMGVLAEPELSLELIDGNELPKPLPKKLHYLVQAYLVATLWNLLRGTYLVGPELNVWCGKDRLVPDVTVVQHGAEYRDGDLVSAPVLCVEILSPGQTIGELMDRANRLVKAGAQCWIIWPERRRAWSLSAVDLIELTESLTLGPIVIALAEIWAELDQT